MVAADASGREPARAQRKLRAAVRFGKEGRMDRGPSNTNPQDFRNNQSFASRRAAVAGPVQSLAVGAAL